jgi:hypothetical protein
MTDSKLCPCPDHEGERLLPLSAFGKNRSTRDGLHYWCRICQRRGQARYLATHPEKVRAKNAANKGQLREQVFGHYGRTCACCGSTDRLCIDHINGDGRAHRITLYGRANAAGTQFYRWLIQNGFPPGFQVLCLTCSTSKGDGPACGLHHQNADMKHCSCPAHEGSNPLPRNEFGADRDKSDGLRSQCRTCTNHAQASRRRANHTEHDQEAS